MSRTEKLNLVLETLKANPAGMTSDQLSPVVGQGALNVLGLLLALAGAGKVTKADKVWVAR